MQVLEFMSGKNADIRLQVEIKLQLITAYLDSAPFKIFLDRSEWVKAIDHMNDVIEAVINEGSQKKLSEHFAQNVI